MSTTMKLLSCIWCYFILINNSIKFAYCLASYANVSRSWMNNWSIDGGITVFNDNSTARTALYVEDSSSNDAYYPPFGFGFFTNQTSNSYILAMYVYIGVSLIDGKSSSTSSPVVVWCANRDHPVRDDATLELTSDGDLVLRDVDGTYVWSTNTSGLSVMSINLQVNGNLMLLNRRGAIIWESRGDYSTDAILYGPNEFFFYNNFTYVGIRLTSRISMQNYSTGKFYVTEEVDGYHAFVNLNPPQEYRFLKSSSSFIYRKMSSFSEYHTAFIHYMCLDPNGRLNVFELGNQTESYLVDLFEDDALGDCAYPTTCGNYGICTNRDQCSCPVGSDGSLDYFQPNEAFNAKAGCSLVTPLSCPDNNNLHNFLELPNVTYFDSTPTHIGSNIESCKRECLNNCSCKAVFFRYYDDSSFGNCTLTLEILTMMDGSAGSILEHNVSAFIKVQNRMQNTIADAITSLRRKLVTSVSASLIALVLVVGVCFYGLKWKTSRTKEIDDSLGVFVDTVNRFSFETLKSSTLDFQTRLGRGGFGSVFQGTLTDGTEIAVKRLDSFSQGRKEFLAEVNSIGSLHHFNLVKLIGFCDDGMNRLLVYEYMCNGSLDKWIFNSDVLQRLNWTIRRHIIEGVAAGLEYLHEHCKQNVIHFDIKPQNILLDKDFNVKISDFGLAKMVDRDQGQVLTIVRGTPGYMAPELIKGHAISVKVDVYSFGVLVLEIVCGRRNVGPSEGDCLTNLVKAKADEDQLSDLIDEVAEDMRQYKVEIVNMMKIAIWCLQPHFIRPTMSKVVKVLQDLSNIEALSDLNDLTMFHEITPVDANYSINRPSDVLLSGPR